MLVVQQTYIPRMLMNSLLIFVLRLSKVWSSQDNGTLRHHTSRPHIDFAELDWQNSFKRGKERKGEGGKEERQIVNKHAISVSPPLFALLVDDWTHFLLCIVTQDALIKSCQCRMIWFVKFCYGFYPDNNLPLQNPGSASHAQSLYVVLWEITFCTVYIIVYLW